MSRNGDPPDLALAVPPELVETIADRVADLVVERLPSHAEPYLDVEAAAEYLACKPHRIYGHAKR